MQGKSSIISSCDSPSRQSSHYSRAGDGGVADGDDVLEFSFENAVEVFRRPDRYEGV